MHEKNCGFHRNAGNDVNITNLTLIMGHNSNLVKVNGNLDLEIIQLGRFWEEFRGGFGWVLDGMGHNLRE